MCYGKTGNGINRLQSAEALWHTDVLAQLPAKATSENEGILNIHWLYYWFSIGIILVVISKKTHCGVI